MVWDVQVVLCVHNGLHMTSPCFTSEDVAYNCGWSDNRQGSMHQLLLHPHVSTKVRASHKHVLSEAVLTAIPIE
jgi:hypothetical protein